MRIRMGGQRPVEKTTAISETETVGGETDAGDQQGLRHGNRLLFFRNQHVVCAFDEGITRLPAYELQWFVACRCDGERQGYFSGQFSVQFGQIRFVADGEIDTDCSERVVFQIVQDLPADGAIEIEMFGFSQCFPDFE